MYETTNTITQKIYVGIHKTKNINDGYLGSGKIIRQAIEKYGKEAFTRRIISFYDSENEMREAEKNYVTEDFVARDDTYNLVVGGGCGWVYVNKLAKGKPRSLDSRNAQSKRMLENYPETLREAAREAAKLPKSEEQKKKANAFYCDKLMMHNELVGRRWVLKDLIVEYLEQGWRLPYTIAKKSIDHKPKKKSGPPNADSETIIKYEKWCLLYKKVGFRKFCEITGYNKTSPSLIYLFKKYVVGFVPAKKK